MRTVYLVNISFGVAGTERRFANLWKAFRARGRVRPVLVIPATQHAGLVRAGMLADGTDRDLWVLREPAWSRIVLDILRRTPARRIASPLRTRIAAPRIAAGCRPAAFDPDAVMHVGLPCSPLVPPDMPLVYECMDSTLGDLGRMHYRRASRRPCVVNCQTARIRDGLRRAWEGHPVRWSLEVSPIYFAHYSPTGASAGIRRDPNAIAFVGRLTPEKSPMMFLRALSMLAARGSAFQATILGEGPLLANVQAAIVDFGLTDRVRVAHRPEIGPDLAASSIFVSLQTGDNYGSQALLEAMGAGCAVVASDVGETGRLVDEGVGLRVPLEPEPVAEAILSLLGDPDRTRRLGDVACRRARTEYTEDRYAEFLEGLYEQATQLHASARSS